MFKIQVVDRQKCDNGFTYLARDTSNNMRLFEEHELRHVIETNQADCINMIIRDGVLQFRERTPAEMERIESEFNISRTRARLMGLKKGTIQTDDAIYGYDGDNVYIQKCLVPCGIYTIPRFVTRVAPFTGSSSFPYSTDLTVINRSYMTDCTSLFRACESLHTLDLRRFDFSRVRTTQEMITQCHKLTSVYLTNANTGNVENMKSMFAHCSNLEVLDLNGMDTSSVTSFWGMFTNCPSLKELDLRSFDTSNVVDMAFMFSYCNSLTHLDIGSFNTNAVKYMDGMFAHCDSLGFLNLDHFRTRNVESMRDMFFSCSSLQRLYVKNFNTSNVKFFDNMFTNCTMLRNLDIAHFNLQRSRGSTGTMFINCPGHRNFALPVGLEF